MTEALRPYRENFDYYAPRALRIRGKDGTIVPLHLNTAQRLIDTAIEAQRARTGRVRALILKGRQQGASTYVEGRFYWKVSGEFGKRAFILTHEDAATHKIFEMAKRYHEHCPEPLKPSTRFDNANTLFFDLLDSGYEVATAKTKAAGRSGTYQYFHGSEVAHWANADDHMAGVGQAVPNIDGTEIVLESTANGIGNRFHRMWQDAEQGASEYIAIFIPWYVQDEYREKTAGISLTDEEIMYRDAHQLDQEQMAWRRAKIKGDFQGDLAKFQQEYPATSAEAFVAVGIEPYIDPNLVLSARKCKPAEGVAPLLIGVDPNRYGSDAMAIMRRRGRLAFGLERHRGKDTMQQAGMLANIIDTEKPAAVFIDVGGVGAGVFDRLAELNYRQVHSVNFGGSPIDERKYLNKRAEMWGLMGEWLSEPPVTIPDDDVLHGDLVGPQYTYDSNGRLKLESKDDMLKRHVKSPDSADALALTFAFPVAAAPRQAAPRPRQHAAHAQGWMR